MSSADDSILTLTLAFLMGTGTGSPYFGLSAIIRTKLFPRFGRTGTSRIRAWFFRHCKPSLHCGAALATKKATWMSTAQRQPILKALQTLFCHARSRDLAFR
jgi:hypothetical protein